MGWAGERVPGSQRVLTSPLLVSDAIQKNLDYPLRRLASHFSRIVWLGGSIVVKPTPIPDFGLEQITLPDAARLAPPCVILSETFVPSGIGSVVYTKQPKRLRLVVRAVRGFSDRTSINSIWAANG